MILMRKDDADNVDSMECRIGCGACCIAPSISSVIPGMSAGKPAGVSCAQLTAERRCRLFGRPERPAVCVSYRARREFCGSSDGEAMRLLEDLEIMTAGGGSLLRGGGQHHQRDTRQSRGEGRKGERRYGIDG